MTSCHTSQPCHAASDESRDITPGLVTMCVPGGDQGQRDMLIIKTDGPLSHLPHVIILAVSVRDNKKEGDTGILLKH